MNRQAIAGLVLVGLVLGVWLLWPRDDLVSTATTTVQAASSTSPITPTTARHQTTMIPETTTTTSGSHVVESIAEAEMVLRDIWFGWFEGIYNQDEDRIREVVATEEQVETARAQFGVMEFVSEPRPDEIRFQETEILRADEDCLAVWTKVSVDSFRPGSSQGVRVLRRHNGRWVVLSDWTYRKDLWDNDCESQL